jgi:hypothetical protein
MMRASEPAPDLKQRVLAAVRSEPATTRPAERLRAGLVLAICAAIAVAIFIEFGGLRRYERPIVLVAWTCLGWVLATGAAAWIGIARGRSMLGRSTAALATLIVLTPFALLAWKIGATLPFGDQMMMPWPTRGGFRCLSLTLAMAAPLLAGCIAIRRRSDPVHPGIAGAALGIMAGVASGTLVDLWCPVAYLPHLLLGHILPLLVAALFGAWSGRRFLGL